MGELTIKRSVLSNDRLRICLDRVEVSIPDYGTPYDTGSAPEFMVAADMDGDGHKDLAVADFESDNISILRNSGDGSFSPLTSPHSGDGPTFVTAADLDSDGDTDLAVANQLANTVSVLLNAGNGDFAEPQSYPVFGAEPTSVTASDLDGDGRLDLAVASFGSANNPSNRVTLFFNQGEGTFGSRRFLVVGGAPAVVIAGDLDADGDMDLATSNAATNDVSVLLNTGDGTFGASVPYPVGQRLHPDSAPYGLSTADLDDDGDLDLISANTAQGNRRLRSSVSVLRNRGDGTFSRSVDYELEAFTYSLSAVPTDIDGDRDLDIVVAEFNGSPSRAGLVSVLLNRGNGSFELPIKLAVNRPRSGRGPDHVGILATDLDGKGSPDIVVSDRPYSTVAVFLNPTTQSDCNTNQIPDRCEPDCNDNGFPDDCDIASGRSQDCDHNGVPDDCDIAHGDSQDCNGNGLPDACEIASDASLDFNLDGFLDECGLLRRGDCNDDGMVDVSDPIAHLTVQFLGEGEILCEDACDSNDDGAVDVSDPISTLTVLFLGQGVIPPPGTKECGVDPTADELGCEQSKQCVMSNEG